MFTYQIRERIFRVDADLSFPNDVVINIFFHKNTAFGNAGSEGRTWNKSTPGGVIFNANTGQFSIDPKNCIDSLDVTIKHSNILFSLKGNELQISTKCNSNSELTALLDSLYYVFPYVLSHTFRDTITVERVNGSVGGNEFRWELNALHIPIVISSQEKQEESVVKAWQYMAMLSSLNNRRIIAALKFYYTACRLARVGNSPWEFMSEIILNLCKALESLFPDSRETVREGLTKLDYSKDEIEEFFIPIMLLRSKIDSGHVFLSLFTREELNTLHAFTELAEQKWQEMLERLFLKLENKTIEIEEHEVSSADKEAKGIVSTIQAALVKSQSSETLA